MKKRLCKKLCVISILTLLTLLLSDPLARSNADYSVYYVEPFSPVLPESDLPPEVLHSNYPNPLSVTMARGEISSAGLIAIRANKDFGRVEISASGIRRTDGLLATWVDVRLIKMVARNNRFMQALTRGNQKLSTSQMWPEVLIYDESAFDEQLKRPGARTVLSLSRQDSAIARLAPGQTRYFLLTIRVPTDARADQYQGSLTVRMGFDGTEFQIPLQIHVLDFVLPLPRKMMSVSNDFGNPQSPFYKASLEDLADHGANVTRLKSVVTSRHREKLLQELRECGFKAVIHHDVPTSREQASPQVQGINQFFYGVDEPQPKRRPGTASWDRMAEHVRRSHRIHELGGQVATSLPYPVALELTQKGGSLYQALRPYGVEHLYEPLDWANYTLALQHLGRRQPQTAIRDERKPRTDRSFQGTRRPGIRRNNWARRRPSDHRRRDPKTISATGGTPNPLQRASSFNQELWDYIARLQEEYRSGCVDDKGIPPSKHTWTETYYFPLGFFRSPFFARFLFGFYLFNSHLDGVAAWTLYRPRGNPFTDADGPDAIIAYPTRQGIVSTYYWEAVREGINDLRYCHHVEELLLNLRRKRPNQFGEFWKRFAEILSPYCSLAVDGNRIDAALATAFFRRTRKELLQLIEDLDASEEHEARQVSMHRARCAKKIQN